MCEKQKDDGFVRRETIDDDSFQILLKGGPTLLLYVGGCAGGRAAGGIAMRRTVIYLSWFISRMAGG